MAESRTPQAASSQTRVEEVPAAHPQEASRHFQSKLMFETDPSDVHADMVGGRVDFILVDTRSPSAFAEEHIPGAINLPGGEISAETTASLSCDCLLITYCWGPGCNGSSKGAARLATLGFRVKEMIGGIEYWKREGFATESGMAT